MKTKNVAASVRARLMNLARTTGRPFQELLQYYGLERFLYRLAVSEYRDRFILKGALMLRVWSVPFARPTRDIDLLGHVDNSVRNLEDIFRSVCATEVDDDGIFFDTNGLTGEIIKEDADYEGVRIKFIGFLERARIPMQIDVGFGDVIHPSSEEIEYPTLLELPAPSLLVYPRETVIAEKFEAMVFLGSINSRIKDFYDIWILAKRFDFDGRALATSITKTFQNRKTTIDTDIAALLSSFAQADSTKKQWSAFHRKGLSDDIPSEFQEIIGVVSKFLAPIARAIAENKKHDFYWYAPGPWRSITR